MPTYDYVCKKCGKQFEYFQSMSADMLAECPQDICQQSPWQHGEVERKIGAGAGLIFNGSGFYLTDYKNSNSPSSSSSSSSAPSNPSATGAASSTSNSGSTSTGASSSSTD